MSHINQNRHFVPKGWGFEDWIDNREEYCIKRMFMLKGKRFSWHYHPIKRETFYIWEGKVAILYGENEDINRAESVLLEAGQSFHIPPGLWHQVVACEDTWIIEGSTTHSDEDVVRGIKGD
jgi:mannose-6-phosphate isomerase-like protein (cupin superfamily)